MKKIKNDPFSEQAEITSTPQPVQKKAPNSNVRSDSPAEKAVKIAPRRPQFRLNENNKRRKR